MYVVLDFETTGLTYQDSAVIEIGALKLNYNLKPYAELNTKVRLPEGVELPYFIKTLTGITEDDLKDAPTSDQAFSELRSFIGGHTVVAHNASFDLGFLHKYLPDLTPDFIDTRYLALALEPGQSGSLANCVERHGIKYEGHHQAFQDCIMTMELLKVYRDMAYYKMKQGKQSLTDYQNTLMATADRPLSFIPQNATIITK